ncbi:Hypothetical protein Cul210932_2082 [Corynebacterium ulcerans]|nr:Hypothetical protein Cul210932_2082 [Corynebacterium ulcerans]ALD95788.1 Hypothetical protein Cul131001_2115 [Corynebacterium ulcerans]
MIFLVLENLYAINIVHKLCIYQAKSMESYVLFGYFAHLDIAFQGGDFHKNIAMK